MNPDWHSRRCLARNGNREPCNCGAAAAVELDQLEDIKLDGPVHSFATADRLPVDEVNHPTYYGGDTPYEVIKVAIAWEEMFGLGFLVLMAIKYLTRNGRKPGQDGRKDLREAVFYIKQEFARRYPGEEL